MNLREMNIIACDVLVIGGGLAGAAATKYLLEKDIDACQVLKGSYGRIARRGAGASCCGASESGSPRLAGTWLPPTIRMRCVKEFSRPGWGWSIGSWRRRWWRIFQKSAVSCESGAFASIGRDRITWVILLSSFRNQCRPVSRGEFSSCTLQYPRRRIPLSGDCDGQGNTGRPRFETWRSIRRRFWRGSWLQGPPGREKKAAAGIIAKIIPRVISTIRPRRSF